MGKKRKKKSSVNKSYLERTFDLGTIPLFLSPFDMADALCSVFDEDDALKMISQLVKKGPFKSGMTQLFNYLSISRETGSSNARFRGKKVVRFEPEDYQILTFLGLCLPFF